MKVLIKLAIAALVAHALFRVGSEYVTFIKFRDAIRDAAMFKARDDEELQVQIQELANQYDVPVRAEDFSIRRDVRHVFVDGSYKKAIEVIPSVNYPWPFTVSIDVIPPPVLPYIPPK